MITLEIGYNGFLDVGRDSTRNDHDTEGFFVWLRDLTIHFEDEQDALKMAKAILLRLEVLSPAAEPEPIVVGEHPRDPYRCCYCGTTGHRSVAALAHHLQTEHYEACVADNSKAGEARKQL